MPQEVLDVTTKFMRDPVRILVKKEELTLEGIRQFYINVEREVKELHFIHFWMYTCVCGLYFMYYKETIPQCKAEAPSDGHTLSVHKWKDFA